MLINTLRQSSNTVIELRRIERLLIQRASGDVTEPLTTAWAHYVNSNNLLSELRGLTQNYPFSSECLDEAKWMVGGKRLPAHIRLTRYVGNWRSSKYEKLELCLASARENKK